MNNIFFFDNESEVIVVWLENWREWNENSPMRGSLLDINHFVLVITQQVAAFFNYRVANLLKSWSSDNNTHYYFPAWSGPESSRRRARKFQVEMFYDVDGVVKIFCCPNGCGRKYRHSSSLSNHLKFECSVEKQFQCTICGRMFSRKPSLKLHLVNMHRQIA